MPTYEYLCEACGHEFEVVQRITEPAIRTCPKCGRKKVKRLVTGGTFILKGSGWYADGYSGKAPEKSEKSEKKESKSETKTTETKSSETKETKKDKKKAGSA